MIRRNPTRTEIKLDDIQEYENLRELERNQQKHENEGSSSSVGIVLDICPKIIKNRPKSEINQRIGLNVPRINFAD